jgi:large subunit ribosomal protein L11
MAKKKVLHELKLLLKGNAATAGPPVSPTISSKGIKAIDFCKWFNDRTKDQKGELLRVKVRVYDDKSYECDIHDVSTAELIRSAAKLQKGSSVPNRQRVGTLSAAQVAAIAARKQKEINGISLEAAVRSVAGTARSMGVGIV